jgi:hypothetical protein
MRTAQHLASTLTKAGFHSLPEAFQMECGIRLPIWPMRRQSEKTGVASALSSRTNNEQAF